MFLGSCAEPDHEGREGDGSEVDVGTLFVACGNGAEALQPVDGTFDGVALLVALTVEPGGPTASRASVPPVSLLVETFRDGVRDSASSQVAAVAAGCEGLVCQNAVRSGTRPSNSRTGHRYLLQHTLELGPVTVVSGRQDEREGSASPVGDKVELGGESAAGTSQALADLTTSSSRTASFRSTGSAWFVPRPVPF